MPKEFNNFSNCSIVWKGGNNLSIFPNKEGVSSADPDIVSKGFNNFSNCSIVWKGSNNFSNSPNEEDISSADSNLVWAQKFVVYMEEESQKNTKVVFQPEVSKPQNTSSFTKTPMLNSALKKSNNISQSSSFLSFYDKSRFLTQSKLTTVNSFFHPSKNKEFLPNPSSIIPSEINKTKEIDGYKKLANRNDKYWSKVFASLSSKLSEKDHDIRESQDNAAQTANTSYQFIQNELIQLEPVANIVNGISSKISIEGCIYESSVSQISLSTDTDILKDSCFNQAQSDLNISQSFSEVNGSECSTETGLFYEVISDHFLLDEDNFLVENSQFFTNTEETESELNREIDILEKKRDGKDDDSNISKSVMSSQFFSTDKAKISRELMKRIQSQAPNATITIKNSKYMRVECDCEDGFETNRALIATLQVLFPILQIDDDVITIGWENLIDEVIRNFRITYQAQIDRLSKNVVEKSRSSLKEILNEEALNDCLREISDHYQPKDKPLTCFVSYAWGNKYTEQVKKLVDHLRLAGFDIPFDLDNGPSHTLTRYIQQEIDKADFVVVVGTKGLLQKYELCKEELQREAVVKAELELICDSFMHNEKRKSRIRTLLWEGTVDETFPPLLRTLVRIENFKHGKYIEGLLELISSLYQIPRQDAVFQKIKQICQQKVKYVHEQDLKTQEKQFQQQQTNELLNTMNITNDWMFDKLKKTLNNSSIPVKSPKLTINTTNSDESNNNNFYSVRRAQSKFSLSTSVSQSPISSVDSTSSLSNTSKIRFNL